MSFLCEIGFFDFAYVLFSFFCFLFLSSLHRSDRVGFARIPRLSGIHFSLCCASWLNRPNRIARAHLSYPHTYIFCFRSFPINPWFNRFTARCAIGRQTEYVKKWFCAWNSNYFKYEYVYLCKNDWIQLYRWVKWIYSGFGKNCNLWKWFVFYSWRD